MSEPQRPDAPLPEGTSALPDVIPDAGPDDAAGPSSARAPRGAKRATATMTVDASRASGAPAAPPAVPKEVVCPICATHFDPRAAGGRCPVCGEQVVATALVTRRVAGLSPLGTWLKSGGWRIVLVVLLIIYEVVLFIYVWHGFSVDHLL